MIAYDPRAASLQSRKSIAAHCRNVARRAARAPSPFGWTVATVAAAAFAFVLVLI